MRLAIFALLLGCAAKPVVVKFDPPVTQRFVPEVAPRPVADGPDYPPAPVSAESCEAHPDGIVVSQPLLARAIANKSELTLYQAELEACNVYVDETSTAVTDAFSAYETRIRDLENPPFWDTPGFRFGAGFVTGAAAIMVSAWALSNVR